MKKSQTTERSITAPSATPNRLQPKTVAGKRIAIVIDNFAEPIELVGRSLMGELWSMFCTTIQDAIALALMLQIPGIIGQFILGKSFSGFDVCLTESPLGTSRYACFIIVASDFTLWIVLFGRVLGRFWADLGNLSSSITRTK